MSVTGLFNRNRFVAELEKDSEWDITIIGGGATGLGIALDAASRGYATLLLEQSDFAKGTSSRSTKLVHGGVRYLAQGNIGLVYHALHERGLLLKNAAHLVKRQAFIIPCYSWLEKFKYLIGLKLYDLLSGRFSFGKSRFLKKEEVSTQLRSVNTKGLVGGVEYFDGQFDDSRLAVNIAQTSAEYGGVLLNYFQVTGLKKEGSRLAGVTAKDLETQKEYAIRSKVVINATGVFVDEILQMDNPGKRRLVRPSQGIHLVFHKSYLKASKAIMIPKTADGRVLFAVPWHDHMLVGTTDTPLEKNALEPMALEQEISFILNTIKEYTNLSPSRKDVLSVFAGLRPLAAPDKNTNSTKEISRDHKLIINDSGLVTITGGKWTTYRKMAEETVDKSIHIGNLSPAPCKTTGIPVHGSSNVFFEDESHFAVYGSDYAKIKELIRQEPALETKLISHMPYIEAEVVWAARNEMARTVEDILARRIRVLFLDAKAAIAAAPRVAKLLASALGYTEAWEQSQVETFTNLANQYLLKPYQLPVEEPSGISMH